MDIKQVERVVKLFERSQLHEMTVVEGGQSIKVVNAIYSQRHRPQLAADNGENISENDSNESAQVRATHVGIVHLSADAVTDNLIKKGDRIEKGQTVCFIEELTRLLPVVSEHDGIVSAIGVEDGIGVEYGQPILDVIIH
ncbi:acetyl-CoA carboxylase biotin carboxyl carrier protein [Psychrobacter pocilloporae]|uniref:acetyl-CoA carboxylase biotin carboxyl carrier protein n=1 Tax=Psychrobacter pocilloporae TaxID=1775882 RepID=UPI003C309832